MRQSVCRPLELSAVPIATKNDGAQIDVAAVEADVQGNEVSQRKDVVPYWMAERERKQVTTIYEGVGYARMAIIETTCFRQASWLANAKTAI